MSSVKNLMASRSKVADCILNAHIPLLALCFQVCRKTYDGHKNYLVFVFSPLSTVETWQCNMADLLPLWILKAVSTLCEFQHYTRCACEERSAILDS